MGEDNVKEVYENPNQTGKNTEKVENKLQVKNKSENANKIVGEKPSKAWYILPIFFGFIGGLIGYFIIKDRDKKMATSILIVGIAISAISIIFSVLLITFGALAYYGMFAPSGFIGPTARGFGDVSIISPWDVKTNGDILLKVENRVGEEITINKVYVNDKETTSKYYKSIPMDVLAGLKSDMINVNSDSLDVGGETYSLRIAIEYCLKNQGCSQSFNSSGTISGTYS